MQEQELESSLPWIHNQHHPGEASYGPVPYPSFLESPEVLNQI